MGDYHIITLLWKLQTDDAEKIKPAEKVCTDATKNSSAATIFNGY